MPKLISVKKMIAVEQAQVKLGVSLDELMRHAGRELANVVAVHSKASRLSKKAVALVGSGNNGGDALVALSHLARNGWTCATLVVNDRGMNDPLIGEVAAAGCEVLDSVEDMSGILDGAVVIDGILGTGFKLPLRENLAKQMAEIAALVKRTNCEVFAVDCPSGVDCDSGEAAEECVPADVTVCMAAVKAGLLKFPAAPIAGKIIVVEIGISENNPEWISVLDEVPDVEKILGLLPKREVNSHKGSFGKTLIVGGCVEYPGAPVLSAMGAYSMGTGLVRVASTELVQRAFACQLSEVVWTILKEDNGYLCPESAMSIRSILLGQNAIVIGPGLGQAESVFAFIREILIELSAEEVSNFGTRCVIDADGLRHLARLADWQELLPPQSVLTPHPGEFAAISGELGKLGTDRLQNAKTAAKAWNCVVVLKGAFTIVAAPDGRAAVIPIATSALAKAGTGDVLSGMIAGLIAQGLPSFEAAVVGASIHGLAGLAAAEALKSDRSVMASDLRYFIGDVLANLPDQVGKPGLLCI